MPTKQTTKKRSTHQHKRRGSHHRHTKTYLKAYWPYVPITLVIALGLFLGTPRETHKPGVLAYATEISSQQLLKATNSERTERGKASLKLNKALSEAAQAKANDMAKRDYWSHITPDGKDPWYFISNAGYTYQKAGENLAYGFSTSNETVRGWMNSPSHRDNLLDASFSEVGFGYINTPNYNNSGSETIVVAMYAAPAGTDKQVAAHLAGTAPLNSQTVSPEPRTASVSLLQNIAPISASWVAFIVGVFSGAALLFIVTKHGIAFKRALIQGEDFILHHPTLDIALVSLVMIGYVLSQSSGFIK